MNGKNCLRFRSIFCLKNCLDMRYTRTFMGDLSAIGYRVVGGAGLSFLSMN